MVGPTGTGKSVYMNRHLVQVRGALDLDLDLQAFVYLVMHKQHLVQVRNAGSTI